MYRWKEYPTKTAAFRSAGSRMHYAKRVLTPNADRVWALLESGIAAQDVARTLGVRGAALSAWLHRKSRIARWEALKRDLSRRRRAAGARRNRTLTGTLCGRLRGPAAARTLRQRLPRLTGMRLRVVRTYARHPDVAVRRALAETLAAHPAVPAPIRRYCWGVWAQDPDPGVRAGALACLAVWGPPDVPGGWGRPVKAWRRRGCRGRPRKDGRPAGSGRPQ